MVKLTFQEHKPKKQKNPSFSLKQQLQDNITFLNRKIDWLKKQITTLQKEKLEMNKRLVMLEYENEPSRPLNIKEVIEKANGKV